MAKIKVKLSDSENEEGKRIIYYQITHEKKTRRVNTCYQLYPDEWSERRSTVIMGKKRERYAELVSVRNGINSDLERILGISHRLQKKRLFYSVDDIAEEFKTLSKRSTLYNFMNSIIKKLLETGKTRTAETYVAALNSFKRFHRKDILIDSFDTDLMERYEAFLIRRGLIANTRSFYMRILRAVYNRAVENGFAEQKYPFRHVYTGVDKTVKRALPLSIIRKIKSADLSGDSRLEYARDIFMLSFFLRGMSFIDMAYLRKTDLKSGYIVYRRRKTGQLLTVKWTVEMQAILERYPLNPTDYLLPILSDPADEGRSAYRSVCYSVNRQLKKLAQMLKLSIPLTLYVARHSWASAAKSKGVPLSVISEGMGHESELTTQIYLASLDTNAVDQANSIIINSL